MGLINCRPLVAKPWPFLLVIGLLLPCACTSTAAQEAPLPTERSLSRNAALVTQWANRVLARDPNVRANAQGAVVQGAQRSFPLLRRFLDPEQEDLRVVTFQI